MKCKKYEVFCQYVYAIHPALGKKWIYKYSRLHCSKSTQLCLSVVGKKDKMDMNRFPLWCDINPVRDADYISVCFPKLFMAS